MLQRIRNLSLGAKLILCFSVILLLPVLLSGVYFYGYTEQSTLMQSKQVIESSLTQLRLSILHKVDSIENTAQLLCTANNIQTLLDASYNDIDDALIDYQFDISPTVRLMLAQNKGIYAIHIVLNNYCVITEMRDSYFSFRKLLSPEHYELRKEIVNKEEGWHTPYYASENPLRTQDIDKMTMSYARDIYGPNMVRKVGVMIIEVYEDYLFEGLSDKTLEDLGTILILDSGRMVVPVSITDSITQSADVDVPMSSATQSDIMENALVISLPLDALNLWLAGIFPVSTLTRSALDSLPLIIAVLTALIFLLSAVFYFTTRILLSRLRQLSIAMDRVRKGDYTMRVHTGANDEIGQLSDAFNQMAERIEVLIETNYKITLMEKEAEFRALEAQINPHFLYNTLATISWTARANKDDKLAGLSDSLARFYRLVLSKGKSMIPVQDEIAMVTSYLFIQKYRFEDRFDVSISISEETKNKLMLKNIMQPLVENALEHGIDPKRARGFIDINVYLEDGFLFLCVGDDGVGMTEEQAKKLERGELESQKDSGYAVKSIIERLSNIYGGNYTFTVTSTVNHGTSIRISIPANGGKYE